MKKILPLFTILLSLDLISKYLITSNMTLNQSIPIINNFFYLHYVENTGAAFSILQNSTLFLIMIALLILAYVIYSAINTKNPTWWVAITYALLMAGITGNLFDRVFNGAVVDFLSFNFFGYYFPIFNLADSFIILAIASLIIVELRKKEGAKNA